MKAVVMLVTAALVALPAAALPPPHTAPKPVRRVAIQVKAPATPAPAMLTGQDGIIANYLQLSAEQRQQWADFRSSSATDLKPLLDEQRDLQRQLQAAIAAGTDTCAIGELTMSVRHVTDQIASAQNLSDEQMSVLTADQQMRYQAFMAAVSYLRQH